VRPSFEDVVQELPEQARSRLQSTPEELTKLVTSRVATWT
jgi:dihydroxyacetone kinase-like predicted kinase